jgi:hypothetical protein
MKETLVKLFTVKSIVTIVLTAVFAFLAVTNRISEQFMMIYTVVISFYFGTQYEKKNIEAGGQK